LRHGVVRCVGYHGPVYITVTKRRTDHIHDDAPQS